MCLVADGVAGGRELQADRRRDITGIDPLQLRALVRVHLQDSAETLLLVLRRVEDVGTGICDTGIDTEECQFPDKRICHDLERKRRERLFIGRMSLDFVAVHVRSLDRRDVRRSRHVLDDRVDHLLHALVSVCAAACDRHRSALAGRLAERSLHGLHGRLLALQVHVHEVVVQLADLLYQLIAVQLRVLLHICRDLADRDVIALVIIVDVGFHLEQVDDTFESILRPDRDLQHDGILAQTVADLFHTAVVIGAHDVHLVDESHTRDIVGIRLTPDVLRLRFHAALRREDTYRAVQHAQRTLDFHREVDVTGRIDNIDTMLQCAFLRLEVVVQRPVACGRGGCDRDTALLFLLHPVHGSSAVVCITDLVVDTGVIEDPLRERRLAGVNMRHDTDVPGSLQGIFSVVSCHSSKTSEITPRAEPDQNL